MQNLSKTAKYYATHPEARKKRLKQQAAYNRRPDQKKYRVELNQYNRKKGTYGNGDKKDATHKGGKIVGFEDQSKNRARKTKKAKRISLKKKT